MSIIDNPEFLEASLPTAGLYVLRKSSLAAATSFRHVKRRYFLSSFRIAHDLELLRSIRPDVQMAAALKHPQVQDITPGRRLASDHRLGKNRRVAIRGEPSLARQQPPRKQLIRRQTATPCRRLHLPRAIFALGNDPLASLPKSNDAEHPS